MALLAQMDASQKGAKQPASSAREEDAKVARAIMASNSRNPVRMGD